MSDPLALIYSESDFEAMIPYPALDVDKYSRGTVAVIGGSASYPGAPILASMAASRSGAGYVRLVTTEGAALAAHSHLLSIPVTACDEGLSGTFCATSVPAAESALAKSDVVLMGPGMGTSSDAARFMAGISQDRPMVFDADALNLISKDRSLLDTPAAHPRVLTPHEGEAARLLGRKVQDRKADALELASAYQAVVVLKGHDTLVATPEGELCMVDSGGPELAKAGTGDVLGGIIASFMCQGLDAYRAASLSVHVHGRAGALARKQMGVHAVMPEDIIDRIGPVLLDMEEGFALEH